MNHAITTLLFEANRLRAKRKAYSDDTSIPEADKADLIVQITAEILECDEAVNALIAAKMS